MSERETVTPESPDEVLATLLERIGAQPFVEHLGCEFLSVEPGHVCVRLPWRDAHCRSGVARGAERSLHGGVAASLADIAAAAAAPRSSTSN